jgi:ABC-type multidrug transport system ATPase subunit
MPATVTAVVGNMGVGKSTLLRICAGLITPDDGWVKFGERKFDRPRLHEMSRAGLFFMGERSGLAESLTVGEHFDMIAKRFGLSLDEKLIESFALSSFLDSKPHRLSTGERRRAELAIAMTRRPKCLIADEPFRELDPMTCEQIGSGLRSLASDGCAVIVSGQEVRTVLHYSDSVTWVTAGTTYDLGTPKHASRDERFAREFLGPRTSL